MTGAPHSNPTLTVTTNSALHPPVTSNTTT